MLQNRVRWARKVAGLSQQELSLRAGLAPAYVCQLESGRFSDPRTGTVAALAKALRVPFEWLASGVGKRPSCKEIRGEVAC